MVNARLACGPAWESNKAWLAGSTWLRSSWRKLWWDDWAASAILDRRLDALGLVQGAGGQLGLLPVPPSWEGRSRDVGVVAVLL